MTNAAIVWTFSGVLAAACFGLGIKMLDLGISFWPIFWYATGALSLFLGAMMWGTLEQNRNWRHKSIIGTTCLLFLSLAIWAGVLWVSPLKANAQGQAPTLKQDNQYGPNLNVPGNGNTFNFNTQVVPPERGPRRISLKDSEEIANILHGAGTYIFQISILSNDRETLAFAEDVLKTMQLAGWIPFQSGYRFGSMMPQIYGVAISQHAKDRVPKAFDALSNAFSNHNIIMNDDLAGNSFADQTVQVEIFVGPRQ